MSIANRRRGEQRNFERAGNEGRGTGRERHSHQVHLADSYRTQLKKNMNSVGNSTNYLIGYVLKVIDIFIDEVLVSPGSQRKEKTCPSGMRVWDRMQKGRQQK